MTKKIYDLAVKTGEYTNQQGETKGRWQNVGAIMQGDDGNKFVMLAKWFNPAGVPDLNGKNAKSESILMSCFAPKQADGSTGSQPTTAAPRAAAPVDEDSIPF
jgi:hypothetical protein